MHAFDPASGTLLSCQTSLLLHYKFCPSLLQLQVSSQTGGPLICVWDSRGAGSTGAPGSSPDSLLAKLQLDKEMRGIVALGFSPDGSLLAGVATDNSHTVSVWDWRNGWRLMGEGKGCMGEPPQVRDSLSS
jgi:microtubule-associated protein-like 6